MLLLTYLSEVVEGVGGDDLAQVAGLVPCFVFWPN